MVAYGSVLIQKVVLVLYYFIEYRFLPRSPPEVNVKLAQSTRVRNYEIK